ncbi:MAG: iron chelate uptake ABC transporter family permease subunit, partial [Marinirhabdus sp.]
MQKAAPFKGTFVWLSLLLAVVLVANISLGSVAIPFKEILSSLFGEGASKQSWYYIVNAYRLPKAITAVLTGSGLAVSGLLMQTLFRNPLAGPFVLGLSSGASLGVALLILGAGSFGGFFGTVLLSQ